MPGSDAALRRLRAFCLSLPETSESPSYGHPNFRAGTRTFAAFEWVGGRPSIAIRLAPLDVSLLLGRAGFFATPYGRGQWASVWADGRLNWREIERLLDRSYRTVALQRMIAALPRRSSKARGSADHPAIRNPATASRTGGRRSLRARAR